MTKLIEKFRSLSMVFFILTLLCGLIYAIFVLDNILLAPANDKAAANSIIDQTLISNLSSLKKSSDNNVAQTLPSGKINPFAQ
ncbi:MAG: hypothetical protein WCH58_00140 [Candidatus Saccharibacteria bacterium]